VEFPMLFLVLCLVCGPIPRCDYSLLPANYCLHATFVVTCPIFDPDCRQQLCLLPFLLPYISTWIYSSLSQPLDCLAVIIQCSAYDKFSNEGVNCHVSCYFNNFLIKLFYKFSIMILKNIFFL
jgi:hypothetical protein